MRTIITILILLIAACAPTPEPEFVYPRECVKHEMKTVTICTSDGMGKALVGGLLFGTTGAVIGGAAARQTCRTETREECVQYETIQRPNPNYKGPGK